MFAYDLQLRESLRKSLRKSLADGMGVAMRSQAEWEQEVKSVFQR
jgi:hypothetical protein